MGPRPNGRGKLRVRVEVLADARGLQWGRGQTAAESAELFEADGWIYKQLQWGRGQTAAERRGAASVDAQMPFASMGPRPNGRGKPRSLHAPRLGTWASMGPRPNGRGKV